MKKLLTALAVIIGTIASSMGVTVANAQQVHTLYIPPGDEKWNPSGQYVTRADDFGTSTWLKDTGSHSFQVSSGRSSRTWSAYPYIGRGCSWGVCAGDAWPMKVRNDGAPYVRFNTKQTWHGRYNTSLDLWFSTWPNRTTANNGTELMIWTSHPNISIPHVRKAHIDGKWWWVTSWRAHNSATHASWNYVAFIAMSQSGSFNGWLNPFMRTAESYGKLRSYWYWTSIEAGFELDGAGSGQGLGVYNFTVSS